MEWVLIAFALAAAAAAIGARVRPWPAIALAAFAVFAAAIYPAQSEWLARQDRAVIRVPTHLEGTEIELESGQVVRIVSIQSNRARIVAGRGVSGWVPALAVYRIGELIP